MKTTIMIDFPPRFAVRWGHGEKTSPHIDSMFAANRNQQIEFIDLIASFAENYLKIPLETQEDLEPRWKQNWFPPLDGMSAYAMVAGKTPKRLIEIGSGNSTKFFARAKRDHNLSTEITSIDPFPRAEIDVLCHKVHRKGLEDVDLSVFDQLEKGDVVFFDGSHRSFQNSDVSVFFIDVLPRLAEGVIVGLHDIFWPDDYPEAWLGRYYNEQFVLGAYILAFGDKFPLVFATSHAWKRLGDELKAKMPAELLAKIPPLTGGCFWWEKRNIGSLA